MNIDVTYNQKKDLFYTELKEKVNSYFKEKNISIKGNMKMYTITIALVLLTYVPYFLILFGGFPKWIMLILAFTMGVGIAGIGMGIMHDGSHNAYSHNKYVNYFMGSLLNLAGSHKYIWDLRHNDLHHMYTNVFKYDYDMVKIWMLRHSPEAPRKWYHKYQHLYAPIFVYPYYTMFWLIFYDVLHLNLFGSNFGKGDGKGHPPGQIVGMVLWKAFYFFYMIIIPWIVLGFPLWQILIGFMVVHYGTSLILCPIFQVAHIMMETTHAIPDKDGKIEDTWAVNQVKSSCNFSLDNKVLTWFCGGLNYQLEHHLFPWICSIHYPEIQPIVKETVEKYKLPYNVHPTLYTAFKSHLKYLKKLGAED